MSAPSPLPYGVPSPAFRFRHLATAAGRSALGGPRESALGTLLAVRVVADALADRATAAPGGIARSEAARQWIQSLVVDPAVRAALVALVAAVGTSSPAAATRALARVMDVTAPILDRAARAELTGLARQLAR